MSAIGDEGRQDRRSAFPVDAGETLIEALVVVAITAMVSAMVFPAVSQGFSRIALEEAVSGLRADLRLARAQALRTGEAVDLVVNADGRGYGWTPGPQRALIAGISLAPAGGDVRFHADGSSEGTALRLGDGRAVADFHIDPDLGVLRDAP